MNVLKGLLEYNVWTACVQVLGNIKKHSTKKLAENFFRVVSSIQCCWSNGKILWNNPTLLPLPFPII